MASDTLTTLATLVGAKLKAQGVMFAAAESCTGGWVAQTVTAIAGSSGWFDRGFVTYSDAAKQEMLGVSARTLASHGAVSEETAREMAAGALAHSRAQVAVAITGVAGPGGGSPEKPVGMVCFAWAVKDRAPSAQTRHFKGNRESVRRQSVIFALQGTLELLDG
ncbi:MAG: damage-inducible protein CinA [Betaproteobacteria bacterium RIFCSPLOWO2_12_FULL_64_23]|nr:MAG: damage-inducible protein CinA [Betaproteobacteria bacterium RIFCSPLOWO2_12_FULL_64_23]